MLLDDRIHDALERAVEHAGVAHLDVVNCGSLLELKIAHHIDHRAQALLHEASEDLVDAGLGQLLLEHGIVAIDVRLIIEALGWNCNLAILRVYTSHRSISSTVVGEIHLQFQ